MQQIWKVIRQLEQQQQQSWSLSSWSLSSHNQTLNEQEQLWNDQHEQLLQIYQQCRPRYSTADNDPKKIGPLFTPKYYELDTLENIHHNTTNNNNKKNLLSVHVFKNGGTTMNELFRSLGNGKRYTHVNTNQQRLHDLLLEKDDDNNNNNNKWFRFALTRHPLTRAVSAYHEIKSRTCHKQRRELDYCFGNVIRVTPSNNGTKIITTTVIPPEQLRQYQIEELRYFLQNIAIGNWSAATHAGYHLWLQVSFIYTSNMNPYPLDYLGRFEDFGAELRYLLGDASLIPPKKQSQTPPDSKKNRTKITVEDLPDDIIQLICEIYRDDFCCLDYDFPQDVCPSSIYNCSESFIINDATAVDTKKSARISSPTTTTTKKDNNGTTIYNNTNIVNNNTKIIYNTTDTQNNNDPV